MKALAKVMETEEPSQPRPQRILEPWQEQLRSKYIGLVLGGAIGDALGMPVEGMNREEIQRLMNGHLHYLAPSPSSPYAGLSPGQYTAPTQLMLATIDGLYEEGKTCLEQQVNALLKVRPYLRGASNTVLQALSSLEEKGPAESGLEESVDASVMVRVVSILHVADLDPSVYGRLAINAVRITNKSQDALYATYLYSSLLRHLLADNAPDLNTEKGRKELFDAYKISPPYPECDGQKFNELLARVLQVESSLTVPGAQAIQTFRTCDDYRDVLPSALYCFLRSPTNFEESVHRAITLGGATTIQGFLTGQMSGAYNGINNLPFRLVTELENFTLLTERGRRLSVCNYA